MKKISLKNNLTELEIKKTTGHCDFCGEKEKEFIIGSVPFLTPKTKFCYAIEDYKTEYTFFGGYYKKIVGEPECSSLIEEWGDFGLRAAICKDCVSQIAKLI